MINSVNIPQRLTPPSQDYRFLRPALIRGTYELELSYRTPLLDTCEIAAHNDVKSRSLDNLGLLRVSYCVLLRLERRRSK